MSKDGVKPPGGASTEELLRISKLVSYALFKIGDKELGRKITEIESLIVAMLVETAMRYASYSNTSESLDGNINLDDLM